MASASFTPNYADVFGQRAAGEAVSDLIEKPLKRADLFFLRIGDAKPAGREIILAGPPGTGKTLLND